MTTLRSTLTRVASLLRCAGIAYTGTQLAIWHSFYAADPRRLAGPLAAIAWGAAAVCYLRRRWPAPPLACTDSAFYVLLALGAQWCVPPVIRGEAASWLVIAAATQLIVPTWSLPVVLSVPLTLAAPTAYWAGVAISHAPGATGSFPAAGGGLLLVSAAVHWCGRRVLFSHAAKADIALADADAEAREQYVVLSRSIERREHERLLHDTVLNTLTALARAGGSPADVTGRAREDVALMEYALGGPGDLEAGDRPDGLQRGLLGGIGTAAAQMRARGLAVHVEVTGAAAGTPAAAVPPPVAAALTHAVREALSNVAAHARTAEAWVDVRFSGHGEADAGPAAAGGTGGVQVTVRDAGAGFDPAGVDDARLGLRRSISERVADCGGRASIRSAPGEGTEVRLAWPSQAPPVPPGMAAPRAASLAAGFLAAGASPARRPPW